jgi:desulfoferrodoxin (superoxide reductase-like protein)
MKISLTQKQLIKISRETGMSFHPNMKKQHIIKWVEAGLNGDSIGAIKFSQEVIQADKQYQRELKLKNLGI